MVHYSTSRAITSGVQQGSVLGPILFLIFVNDIINFLPSSAKCKLFADDVKSYITFINSASHLTIPSMLSAIADWSSTWQLPLSVSKCNWMLISNCRNNDFITINLQGSLLGRVDEVKDLGVLFNSKLNFSEHISQIVSKAKQRIYLLFKAFSSSNTQALILAYKTYVLPIVEYCSPVWSPSLVCDIMKLEAVQRLFTRRLDPCRNLSYSERLNYCCLITLERRRLIADLVLLYKIVHNLVTVDLDNALSFSKGSTRGHSYKLEVKRARTNVRLHFFTVRTIKIWNSLTEAVVSATSVNSFKNSLTECKFNHLIL